MRLYRIVFDNGSTYDGGTLTETKWADIPDKQIRTIFYSLPTGDCLALSGYEKYYHFVEVTEDLVRDKNSKKNINCTYLIGKAADGYKLYKINILSNQIDIKLLGLKDSFIEKLNPIGWK